MKKVIHLRDQYLRVSFVYFLLKGFSKYEHWVACREHVEQDLTLYPYDRILKTSRLFLLSWLVDKLVTVKLKRHSRLLNDWIAYYHLLKSSRDEVIALHAHMGPQGFYALPLARKLKKNLFVTFYGSDMSDVPKLPGWPERYARLFAEATCVIVEGPHMKGKIVELGCPIDKVKVIPIGIPLDDLRFSYRRPPTQDNTLQILMCANFYPKKGYLTALKAVNQMVAAGRRLQVHIVGAGPLERQITAYVRENSLEQHVTFYGMRTLPQIYEMAARMHLFFHPSETAPDGGSEGGAPTIILEMQALGLPVVSTTHADIPNIIPAENHFLADEFDAAGLVTQFERLTSLSSWNAVADRGREFVEKHHGNAICAGKLEELYEFYT